MSKNSLLKFSEAILNEARIQSEKYTKSMEERRKSEIASIKNELSTIKKEFINSERKRMERESCAKISAVKAQAFEKVIHTREKMFNEVFECAVDKLREYTKSEEYHEFLRTSLTEIMRKNNKGTALCEVCEADFEFMNTLSKDYSNMEVVYSKSDFIGGFIFKNLDMRLYADNTLSRLIELEKQKFYKKHEFIIEF